MINISIEDLIRIIKDYNLDEVDIVRGPTSLLVNYVKGKSGKVVTII